MFPNFYVTEPIYYRKILQQSSESVCLRTHLGNHQSRPRSQLQVCAECSIQEKNIPLPHSASSSYSMPTEKPPTCTSFFTSSSLSPQIPNIISSFPPACTHSLMSPITQIFSFYKAKTLTTCNTHLILNLLIYSNSDIAIATWIKTCYSCTQNVKFLKARMLHSYIVMPYRKRTKPRV